MHARGGDLPPNFTEASIWLERAAKAGYAGAARTLSQLYQAGMGGVQDAEAAAHWLRQAAELGSEKSQVDLGNLILVGEGAPGDDVRTRHWFERGAKQGNLAAAFNFGICLSHGIGGGHDEAQAALWLRKAADEMPIAQFWYGRMLAEGRGSSAMPRRVEFGSRAPQIPALRRRKRCWAR
ncbi:tetratricopeptide repeat protein [Methylobacterium phyllosphaerae]